jgi:hypothetical protein
MAKRIEDNLLIQVAINFQCHRSKLESNSPDVREFAKKACDIDIWEMWSLTQE